MSKSLFLLPLFWVITFAFGIGINSQLPAFLNEYAINGDVPQHIYWAQQFRDGELFRDDFLTDFTKQAFAPWGYLLFYWVLSIIIEPLVLSKILPILLFIISSVYVFKLVNSFADTHTAFLASLLFMIFPQSLQFLAGGLQRGFGLVLFVAFLNYLVRKDHGRTSLVLVLQSAFYPMLFFVEALTYLFTHLLYIHLDGHRPSVSLETHKATTIWPLLGICIGLAMVVAKHSFSFDPSIGHIVTREQMVNRPEFYAGGRFQMLPTPSIGETVLRVTTLPYADILRRYSYHWTPLKSYVRTGALVIVIMIAVVILWQALRRKLALPLEFGCLFLASVLLYVAADVLLFRLYLPVRYLESTAYLLVIITGAIVLSHVTRLASEGWPRHVVKVTTVVLILLHFNLSKGAGLTDMSENKVLYQYLRTLPKGAMIAAHPTLADYIPTFSGRKVFINFETSQPFFDRYWETVKGRTVAFFDAYYSPDRVSIYDFCTRYRIDYLVVHKRDFSEEYLHGERLYFEPFNTYLKRIVKDRSEFAALNISERDKVFSNGEVFVIHRNVLRGPA